MSHPNPAYPAEAPALRKAERELRALLSSQPQWLMSKDGRAPLAVNNDDFDLSAAHRALIFTSWTEEGSRAWRITGWSWSGDKLVMNASRRSGAETSTIELVPCASARAMLASIAAARQARCERLAALLVETMARTSVSGSGNEDQRLKSVPL